jgi:hypothetical protein
LDGWFHGRAETLSEVNFLAERMSRAGEFTPQDAFVVHLYGRYCNANKFAGEVDLFETLEAVKKQYRIDENRLVMRGFSMGGAAAFAVHIVLLGHLATRVTSEALTFLQISGAAAFAWGVLPWAETPAIRWRPAVVLAVVAGALLATAVAFYLQTWAQRYVGPTRAALIFALEPVFAWVVAWWWTGEVFTLRAAAGAALILAGVVLVELKPNRRAAHQSNQRIKPANT